MDNNFNTPPIKKFAGTPLSVWRKLYDIAIRLQKLNPWEWMTMANFFCVRTHPNKETNVVIFQQKGADSPAWLTLYRGWNSFRVSLAPVNTGNERLFFERLLEESWLRIIYLSYDKISSEEQRIWQALELGAPHNNLYPSFVSQRVGIYPGLPLLSEIQKALPVLYQAYGMAMRIESEPSITHEHLPESLFTRVQDAAGNWHDEWVEEASYEHVMIDFDIDLTLVRRLEKMPQSAAILQTDLVLTPINFNRRKNRVAVFVLLLIDRETNDMVSCEAMRATSGFPTMWANVPNIVLKDLVKLGALPAEIEVSNDRMFNMLRPLTELLPFKLRRRTKLKAIDSITDLFDKERKH